MIWNRFYLHLHFIVLFSNFRLFFVNNNCKIDNYLIRNNFATDIKLFIYLLSTRI
jgi:hypothetical protein